MKYISDTQIIEAICLSDIEETTEEEVDWLHDRGRDKLWESDRYGEILVHSDTGAFNIEGGQWVIDIDGALYGCSDRLFQAPFTPILE